MKNWRFGYSRSKPAKSKPVKNGKPVKKLVKDTLLNPTTETLKSELDKLIKIECPPEIKTDIKDGTLPPHIIIFRKNKPKKKKIKGERPKEPPPA